MTDAVLERLRIERLRIGRGSLTARRDLWRFCTRVFREWHGLHLVDEGAPILERALTHDEMVEWLRLAEEFPAAARDVLRLQRDALREGKRIVMRAQKPEADKSWEYLAELHEYALLGAGAELNTAQSALARALRETDRYPNGPQRVEHRRRMIVALDKTIAGLSDQLQILRTAARPTP